MPLNCHRRLASIRCAIVAALLASQAGADTPSDMPLLPPGQYHTFETGFNIDNPRFIRRAIARYQQDATQAGMQVKPIEFGWPELEPTEGAYDLREMTERLEEYQENGWRPIVFIRAIDSDDITVPAYLKGTDEAISLTEIDVSTPRFIARYNALMDVVVPIVREHDGFVIMVANEADNFLGPHPELTDQVTTFLNTVRSHIHSIDDQMAVGIALSNGFDHDDDADAIRPPRPHHLALIGASDIAAYNFYCLKNPSATQTRDRIQSRIDAADGKSIMFQELGCPSGEDAGFSDAFQQQFFESAFSAMDNEQIRISIVFQLVDWTQATIEFYADALLPLLDAEPAFQDNPNLIFLYLNQLGSIGMINATDGEPKPAWFTFLDALENGQSPQAN